MKNHAYLGKSRHDIYYFRWPIPRHLHPSSKATDIKVSLQTRTPQIALRLSRILVCAGQSEITTASVSAMRYDEIRRHVREHFTMLLENFREDVAVGGQVSHLRSDSMRASQALTEGSLEDFVDLYGTGGSDRLLRGFCERRGISADLPPETQTLLLQEIKKGFKTFLASAIQHNASFDNFELEGSWETPVKPSSADLVQGEGKEALADVMTKYIDEGKHTELWQPKTLEEKQDAHGLLVEIIGNKPIGSVSKSDARKAKEVLLKLPKNRRKMSVTRDLSLEDMLRLPGIETISTRTANSYMSHFQSFMSWADKQGYVASNVFEGMRFSKKSGAVNDGRKPFSTAQLQTMYLHLTDNPDQLVKKDDHKWPVLIAMFTGARLNEVAQLTANDISELEGIWCFDFNDDGEKSIKNNQSRRIVPIHSRLLELGFLAFVEEQNRLGSERLFGTLSYSAKNGYGRNVGRWFNERFLPTLGFKEKELVFHSLRHTMVTTLARNDVPDSICKAIVGHSQSGVTFSTYFKEGYKVEQLQRELNKFTF